MNILQMSCGFKVANVKIGNHQKGNISLTLEMLKVGNNATLEVQNSLFLLICFSSQLQHGLLNLAPAPTFKNPDYD